MIALVAAVPAPASTQGMEAERMKALAALVARGAKALADGQTEQARAAWTLAVAFAPDDVEAREKLGGVPPAMFSLTEQERAFMSETVGKSDSGDWCTFPEPTPRMEVIALKILADTRLLPNLRVTNLSFSRAGCDSQGVFMFVARPDMTMAELRQAYGEPQVATKKDGAVDVFTYGPLRFVGTREGTIQSVVLTPL
jgi:hypothetical protein